VSLHGKTLSVDRERAFIGSFNLDPRSKNLNTEMGFVIQKTTLAQQISERLEATLPAIAYRVILTPDGSLEWIEQTPGDEVRYHHDPQTGFLKRVFIRILGWLPIDSML
jgi:putative cardiolipin synthase